MRYFITYDSENEYLAHELEGNEYPDFEYGMWSSDNQKTFCHFDTNYMFTSETPDNRCCMELSKKIYMKKFLAEIKGGSK